MRHGNTVTCAYTQVELVRKFVSGLRFDGSLDDFVIKDLFVSHDPMVVKGIKVPTVTNGFGDYVITLSHGCTLGIEFEHAKEGYSFVYLADVDYGSEIPCGSPCLTGRVVNRLTFTLDPDYLFVPCEVMELMEFNQQWNDHRCDELTSQAAAASLVTQSQTLN